MKYAKVIFPKGEVLIELLNTPVVTKWAAAIEIHNKDKDPLMTRIGTFMYHKYYNTDDSPGVIKPYRHPRIELL
jgi:hypothetical protein